MGIINKLKKKLSEKQRNIDPRLLICFECGSDNVYFSKKNIKCRNCGASARFTKDTFRHINFKEGDLVKIQEKGEPSNRIYKIRKVKKSSDGKTYYLLKSDESDISLLYYESVNSHLERA